MNEAALSGAGNPGVVLLLALICLGCLLVSIFLAARVRRQARHMRSMSVDIENAIAELDRRQSSLDARLGQMESLPKADNQPAPRLRDLSFNAVRIRQDKTPAAAPASEAPRKPASDTRRQDKAEEKAFEQIQAGGQFPLMLQAIVRLADNQPAAYLASGKLANRIIDSAALLPARIDAGDYAKALITQAARVSRQLLAGKGPGQAIVCELPDSFIANDRHVKWLANLIGSQKSLADGLAFRIANFAAGKGAASMNLDSLIKAGARFVLESGDPILADGAAHLPVRFIVADANNAPANAPGEVIARCGASEPDFAALQEQGVTLAFGDQISPPRLVKPVQIVAAKP